MPSSVIVAVAAATAAAAVPAALGLAAGGLAAVFVGTLAAVGTSYALSAAFAPKEKKAAVASFASDASARTVTVRQPIAPRRVIYGLVRVGGVVTFMHTTSNDLHMHLVVTLSGHEVDDIGDVFFNDQLVTFDSAGAATTEPYTGEAARHKGLGTPGDVSWAGMLIGHTGIWTSAHRQDGCAKIHVFLIYNWDIYPNGIPNITAMVRGKKVYDPRSDRTVWSDNPALCLADYLNDAVYGLGAAYGTEIDQADLIAAANICDEPVGLASGGVEKRYTCNGTFESALPPDNIIQRMLTAMSGKLVYVGGKWRIHAGAYVTPTVTLTEDDMRGPVRITSRLSRRDIFNSVRGIYVSPENNWQPADFPVVKNSTYLSEDNGETVWRDFELPFTTSAATAQRIAKIELEKVRQQITAVLPCKLSAYRLRPCDTVMVTLPRFGWLAKVFEVAEVRLAFENEVIGCDLLVRETASAVFDWNSGMETRVDPAPDTNLPNPFFVIPPGAPQVLEELYETTGSAGVKIKALVSWGHISAVQVDRYQIEYKLASVQNWTVLPTVTVPNVEIPDIGLGVYNFRVLAINGNGVRSAYSPITNKEILGFLGLPADVTGFSLFAIGNVSHLSWNQHPDLDVRQGGHIVVRYSSKTSSAIWEDGIEIGQFPGAAVQGSVPLLTGTYLAKARDSGGRYSTGTAQSITDIANLITFNAVTTSTQHTTFPGAKTNVVATSGVLKLDSNADIDGQIALIDTWERIDDIGGIKTSGSYQFDSHIDLGAVHTSRLTAAISAISYAIGDTMDGRNNNIDLWENIDGLVISDTTVRLYVRTTNDDPLGSPTWGDWRQFFVGDYKARAFQFKLDFTSGSSVHNIDVSTLSVTVDMPDRIEAGSSTSLAGSDTTVTFTTTFKTPPKVGLTIKNASAGDFTEIVSESAGAFTYNIRNGGPRVARNVNWMAKGF